MSKSGEILTWDKRPFDPGLSTVSPMAEIRPSKDKRLALPRRALPPFTAAQAQRVLRASCAASSLLLWSVVVMGLDA